MQYELDRLPASTDRLRNINYLNSLESRIRRLSAPAIRRIEEILDPEWPNTIDGNPATLASICLRDQSIDQIKKVEEFVRQFDPKSILPPAKTTNKMPEKAFLNYAGLRDVINKFNIVNGNKSSRRIVREHFSQLRYSSDAAVKCAILRAKQNQA